MKLVMLALRELFSKLTGLDRRLSPRSFDGGLAAVRPRRGRDALDRLDESVGFRFPASENLLGDMGSEVLLKAIKSFAPSQPTQGVSQFAGRRDILANVIAAVEEHRNHLVIFGGRGTGKTSLALAMASVARHVGYHCAYISCGRESTIESIFHSALSELSIRFDQNFDPRSDEVDPKQTFASLMPEAHAPPQHLIDILARIRGTRLLIVIDEYDRNENPTLNRDLTEIMKVVADRAIPVQIVIVGVGEVVDSLVGEHASIARALYAVRLTNMSEEQIRDTLQVASRFAEVTLSPDVIDTIVSVSYGRPYIARMVGLKAAKMALLRGSSVVTTADYEAGADELLGYLASAGFGPASRLITTSQANVQLFKAMLACRRDSNDRFSVADLKAELHKVYDESENEANLQHALDMIASPELGVLAAQLSTVPLYHFVDPRAELCVSILCGRALRTAPAARTLREVEQAKG